MHITALPVALPMVVAPILLVFRKLLPRLVLDIVATATAAAVVVLCAILLAHSAHGPFAYWMGNWRPKVDVAIGIGANVDPIGAALATFSSLLIAAALVYSWHYFDSADGLFHALMLVFLAAMAGFALTGDLFNLAVFFELMGAVAYALTAYKNEERGPIQGAINFAISNSLGAYAMFVGIALLYARTGALNMTQIGVSLDGHAADALVVIAMTLLFIGFLTKAAAVPVHFWLADAHAVAPVPVCVLFSGVMVELGIYAVARLYWTIFAGPLAPHADELRGILIAFGSVTALWGAIMCFTQRHVKRLLAFSTISHVGVFLCGVGLLSTTGLGGVAAYVVGHGLVKAALFMLAGVVLHRFATMDEYDLHGRGRGLPLVGLLFAVGAVVLAAMPVTTTFFGKSLLDAAALEGHYPWLPAIFVISSAVTGGAVLRLAGRIFLGWGSPVAPDGGAQQDQTREEEDEQRTTRDRTPAIMVIVPAVLLGGALVLGVIPGLVPAIEVAAAHLGDHGAYLHWVLNAGPAHYLPVETTHVEPYDYLYGAGAVLGAFALAALALFGRSLRERIPDAVGDPFSAALGRFRDLHSGHIGDYIAWWTAGTALLGCSSLLLLT